MIVGNVRTGPIGSLYGEGSYFDFTVYLPQIERSNNLGCPRVKREAPNMDVPEACITVPKAATECIGKIKDVTNLSSLLVNVVNKCVPWAYFDAMKAPGTPPSPAQFYNEFYIDEQW